MRSNPEKPPLPQTEGEYVQEAEVNFSDPTKAVDDMRAVERGIFGDEGDEITEGNPWNIKLS